MRSKFHVQRSADDPEANDYRRLPTREPVLHVAFALHNCAPNFNEGQRRCHREKR